MKLSDIKSNSTFLTLISLSIALSKTLHELLSLIKGTYNKTDDIKKAQFVLRSRKSKMFSDLYPTSRKSHSLQDILSTISKDSSISMSARKLADEIATMPLSAYTSSDERAISRSRHFDELTDKLPEFLRKFSEDKNQPSENKKRLKELADKINLESQNLLDFIESIKKPKEKIENKEKDADKEKQKEHKSLQGKQSQSVEDIVSDIIKHKVPKDEQGKVRNELAKSDNKLLALKQILNKMGIKESYLLEEQKLSPSQLKWLEDMKIKNWKYENGVVNVDGSVRLANKKLTKIPIQFGYVSEDFWCDDNHLTSLKGSPREVGGDFHCSHNQLTSLSGGPKEVGENVWCFNNELRSLSGAPIEVGKNLDCSNNYLTSLSGAPKEVGENFDCSGNLFESEPDHSLIKIGGEFKWK